MKPLRLTAALVVVVSTLVALGLAEGLLRAADTAGLFRGFFVVLNSPYTPFDSRTGGGLYYAHPYVSYEMKPGYRAGNVVSINALGFRNAEFTQAKPAGLYRVVALGGSTTYGSFLRQDETYPHFLDRDLKGRFGSGKVEVINAGMVSATSAETLVRFLLRIVPLQPDMVVFYEGYNDLAPRMFSGFSDDYYHFRKYPRNEHPWLENLYLYRLVESRFGTSVHSPNKTLLTYTWRFENLPPDNAGRVANFERTSAEVYERNLDHMIAVAKSKGIDVVLATFPFNGRFQNWNEHMPAELWARGIAENNAAIRELAARHGLPLLEFAEHASRRDDMFLDSIHLNAAGSREQARFFAEALAPRIAPKVGGASR